VCITGVGTRDREGEEEGEREGGKEGGKKEESERLRIGFNPTRSTSPCYKPTHAYNTYTKMNLTTVKWAQ